MCCVAGFHSRKRRRRAAPQAARTRPKSRFCPPRRAVEGRAAARHRRRREAASRRVVADCAERQRRRPVARAPRRPALFLARRSRKPGRGNMAGEAVARQCVGRVPHDHAPDRCAAAEPPRSRSGSRQRLADPQFLEPHDRKSLLGLDREAVRRAARRIAVVARTACRAARSHPQCPVQSSRPERRPDRPLHSSRLRRPSLFPARLFRVQDGTALRLREMHARRRREAAALPGLVEYPERRAAPGRARGHHRRGRRSGARLTPRACPRRVRHLKPQQPPRRSPTRESECEAGFQAGQPSHQRTAASGTPGIACRPERAGSETKAAGAAAAADRARARLRSLSAIQHRRWRSFRRRPHARRR